VLTLRKRNPRNERRVLLLQTQEARLPSSEAAARKDVEVSIVVDWILSESAESGEPEIPVFAVARAWPDATRSVSPSTGYQQATAV
jgi:hypothetical protein